MTVDLKELHSKLIDPAFTNSYYNFHRRKAPPIHLVNDLPIHFDPKFKSIGISFSGGADSTLLLWILCNLIKDTNSECKIYPIHMIRFYNEKPWLGRMAEDVYNYIKEKFPNILQDMQYGFIPSEFETVTLDKIDYKSLSEEYNTQDTTCDALFTVRYMTYITNKLKLEYVYSGVTTNPPIEHESSPKFREQENTENKVNWILGYDSIAPFTLISKDWIMAQYDNFNIRDLLELTRSCEANDVVLGERYLTSEDYPPICTTCFFCKEREWGEDNKEKYLK